MGPHTAAPVTTVAESPGQSDRRHGNRTPALFSLLYSGMDAGQMLIGDGMVTNLSSCGIGIRGNRSVTPGMEVALFIDLPGLKEPLCVAQSRVSWVAGMSIWSGVGVPEVGGEEASAFLLVGSRHPHRP